jgi:hypothetical protein
MRTLSNDAESAPLHPAIQDHVLELEGEERFRWQIMQWPGSVRAQIRVRGQGRANFSVRAGVPGRWIRRSGPDEGWLGLP